MVLVVTAGLVAGLLTHPSNLHHQQEQISKGSQQTKGQETAEEEERDGKLFVILAKIPATQCSTNDNLTLGTCMASSTHCTNNGGTSKGSCASILSSCCLVTRTCNEATHLNNTYFTHPGVTSTELGACTLTINRVTTNICQMRFDFLALELSQPDTNGICTKDFLTVTGGVSSVPVICGSSSGQHIYYDVDPSGGAVKLTINRSVQASLTTAWNIQVTQVPCHSMYRAPEGCLQYYTGTTDTVYSFNFLNTAASQSAGTRQLANQDYGVCIKRADNYCGITWQPVNQGGNFGFTITGPADVTQPDLIGTINTSSRDGDCTTDYVVIPGGMYTNTSTSTVALPAGRYCGLGFPPSVTTTSQPFVLYVKTDGSETLDTVNRGFCLKYRQTTSCA